MKLLYTLFKTKLTSIYLLIGLFGFSINTGQVNAQVSVTDSLALVAIYNSTNGANWNNKSNWLSANPVSTWHGVTVFAGNVIGLSLNGNNLNGTLPAEIGDLAEMQFIYLIGNQLNGALPDEIGNLSNLRELVAFANSISGSLPNTLGGLTQLQIIQLNSNQITGSIPAALAGSSSVITLNLANNQLSGNIPIEFEDAGSLVQLDLSVNNLSGAIPGTMSRAPNLETLILNDNNLTGPIPFELGDLSNLQAFAAQNNSLSGNLPTELGNLSNLLVMYLDNNFLNGPIPKSFGNLNSLFFLFLNNNEFNGSIPDELGLLSNLRSLYLQDNNLTGKIPTTFGNLPMLRELWINNNGLDGSIPWEIGNMGSIESLILDNNLLTGALPNQITNASTLKYLSLVNNDIDQLPDMSAMPSLISVLVQGNELTFEDIEPNMAATLSNFIYAPQQDVYTPYTESIYVGDPFQIECNVNGTANEYIWMRGGTELIDETSAMFMVNSADISHNGSYTAKVTSPLVPGLEIFRSIVGIQVADPLPIELLNFTAKLKNDIVLLEWATATEANNDYFTVERSDDGVDFKTLTRVDGAGNSQTVLKYSAIDNLPFIGESYYRIKQTDFNGDFTYSNIEVVTYAPEFDLMVYPSPVLIGNNISIRFNFELEVEIEIFDSKGTLIQSTQAEGSNIAQEIKVGTRGLAAGMYTISATSGDYSTQKSFIITN